MQFYVARQSLESIRTQLEAAAIRDRDLDSEVSSGWAAVDEESWQMLAGVKARKSKVSRSVVKSTSPRLTSR